MKDDVFLIGAAAVAATCCIGLSLAAAAGTLTVLALVGVALPSAVLIALGGWAIWYRATRAGRRLERRASVGREPTRPNPR